MEDVGARLAEDDQHDRRFAIQRAGGAHVLRRIQDIGHIGQADSRAMVVADDQRFVVLGTGDLIVGDDIRGHQVIGKLAGGLIGILQAEHGLDIL